MTTIAGEHDAGGGHNAGGCSLNNNPSLMVDPQTGIPNRPMMTAPPPLPEDATAESPTTLVDNLENAPSSGSDSSREGAVVVPAAPGDLNRAVDLHRPVHNAVSAVQQKNDKSFMK